MAYISKEIRKMYKGNKLQYAFTLKMVNKYHNENFSFKGKNSPKNICIANNREA